MKAIELEPTNLEPQWNLAALFEKLTMTREAEAAYDLILLTAPDSREALTGKTRRAALRTSAEVKQAGEVALVHG